MNNLPSSEFKIRMPVKIPYSVLSEVARKKLLGERIQTEEKGERTSYAEIVDIAVAKSLMDGYELAVDVKFKTLTTLFHGKEASVLLDASLDFDPVEQEIHVTDYRLQVETDNWLMKKSLQGLANTIFRNQIKEKMRFDFTPLIEENLQKINEKLEASLEPRDGISLSGFLRNFEITDVIPGELALMVIVELQGQAQVEVKKLEF